MREGWASGGPSGKRGGYSIKMGGGGCYSDVFFVHHSLYILILTGWASYDDSISYSNVCVGVWGVWGGGGGEG